MESQLLDEVRLLCTEVYEASKSGRIGSPGQLKKYVAQFNNLYRQCGEDQSIAETVREWVGAGQGQFFTAQMFAELGLTSRPDKKAGDMALRRLVEKGVLKECGEKRGCWKPVNITLEQIDWRGADSDDVIPVNWPLGLEQYFTVYPTNVIVLAGEKNAGKSAFCLNVCYLNHELGMPIHYFSSEMAAQELNVRLKKFPELRRFDKVKFFPLDFETAVDVLDPDAINIIDYLEVEDEFWKVASKIRKMWQRMRKGIVIVAIQKDPDARYGRGKAFSSEKARVYLTMTKKQKLVLEEIKNFKGDRKPDGLGIPYKFNPNGLLERNTITPAVANPAAGTATVRVVR